MDSYTPPQELQSPVKIQAYIDPIFGVVSIDLKGEEGPGFYGIDPQTGLKVLVRSLGEEFCYIDITDYEDIVGILPIDGGSCCIDGSSSPLITPGIENISESALFA